MRETITCIRENLSKGPDRTIYIEDLEAEY